MKAICKHDEEDRYVANKADFEKGQEIRKRLFKER
jgi:hypothetical protein